MCAWVFLFLGMWRRRCAGAGVGGYVALGFHSLSTRVSRRDSPVPGVRLCGSVCVVVSVC